MTRVLARVATLRRQPLLVLTVLVVAAFSASVVPGVRSGSGYSFRLDGLLSNVGYAAVAVLAAARGWRSGRNRRAWLILAGGLGVYAMGQVYWLLVVRTMDPEPFPSLADPLWLSSTRRRTSACSCCCGDG